MSRYIILGLGKTGKSVYRYLKKRGVSDIILVDDAVSEYDDNRVFSFDDIGSLNDDFVVIKSPGIPRDKLGSLKNAFILSEIEFSYLELKKRLKNMPFIIGITGTDGKSTSSFFIGEGLKRKYKDVFVVGNIGTPFIDFVDSISEDSIVVVELSSYQLEDIYDFHADIGILLNLGIDHLNRYDSIKDYWLAKMNLFKKQEKSDIAILNYDDRNIVGFYDDIVSGKLFFSRRYKKDAYILNDGLFVGGDKVIDVFDPRLNVDIYHFSDSILSGVLVMWKLGLSLDDIREALLSFKGLSHRFEILGVYDGRLVVNDSKSTTVGATLRAIDSLLRRGKNLNRIILILGGQYKEGEFEKIREVVYKNGILLILYGEAIDFLEPFFHGIKYYKKKDFGEAVKMAWELSKEGDAILLSPAAASWDQHKNFEERGEVFKHLIKSFSGGLDG